MMLSDNPKCKGWLALGDLYAFSFSSRNALLACFQEQRYQKPFQWMI
jgi:hypothetical protein